MAIKSTGALVNFTRSFTGYTVGHADYIERNLLSALSFTHYSTDTLKVWKILQIVSFI